uniref:C2 domain-containing protein n=1 Tax=Sinocyclocheilus rhinocerous TaxID=307959 RepID=A0A673GU59_9TELE
GQERNIVDKGQDSLSLPVVSFTDDISASKECEHAPFVPGYNLAGEGFDVVTMERKGSYVINTEIWDLGNGTCKLRKNNYMNGIKQKLPAAVVDWRTLPKCSMKVSSQIFESSEALVNDSSSALSVGWKRQTEIIGGNINGEDLLFSGSSHPNSLKKWIESLKSLPDIVHYSLKPLHFLLSNKHPARKGLKKAVEEYIIQNALMKVCSKPCKIGRKCSARDRCACVCESSKIIKSNCCPAEKGLATLKVYKLRAKGLYGDVGSQTDGTVTVTYDKQIKRTETIHDNDNPRWPETFEFGPIKIRMANKLTFKVDDVDGFWNSDLLGSCSFDLRSGVVTDACVFTYGTFFFTYEVKCAPSLQGPQCNEHKPSPMAAPLTDIFSSRNETCLDSSDLSVYPDNSFKIFYVKL